MKFKEILSRLTGISVPFFGVSWNPPEAQRAAVRRILTFLEDRRVLYALTEMEYPQDCIDSIVEIRRKLTEELGPLEPTAPLAQVLRAMRAACRKFLDDVGSSHRRIDSIRDFSFPAEHWVFVDALGKLRATFGLQVAQLAVGYKIDIEGDLESILPAGVDSDADEVDTAPPLELPASSNTKASVTQIGDPFISPLANVCREAHRDLQHDTARAGPLVKHMIMTAVRDDKTTGAAGEEAIYHNVRRFPSGAMVGMVAVWPGHGEEVYSIVVDEKWPEYFGLLLHKFQSPFMAEEAWRALGALDGRGEELAKQLRDGGWEQLFPADR